MKLADRVSLRSRERKLGLFLETMQPTAATSVLDTGVDDAGFGADDGCATLNLFEERYPWPERITAVGITPGERFREHYPAIRYLQADACALPFGDGEFDVYFSNAVIEHVGPRERQQAFADEALRVAPPRLRDDAEPLVPARGAHAAPARALAPGAGRAPRLRPRAQALGEGEPPARPGDLERLFRGRARIVNLGMTLVAIV